MADDKADRDHVLPLEGTTVVELGNIVAAPFASQVLADMGADVIKVERPETGDAIRGAGPAGDATFAAFNRNKRSIALDLKSEEGRETYLTLAADADVIVENLGPNTVEKLGVGYNTINELNPRIVYLSIKGFQPGPYGDRPGMDMVAESMSGLTWMTGKPGDQPLRVGTSIADIGAALYGVIGVVAALRVRDRTGQGDRIDASLFESTTHWMSGWMAYAALVGESPSPMGATHPSFDLYDVFQVQDGDWVFVGVTNERHWQDFCESTGMDFLLNDDRFRTPDSRLEHKQTLIDTVRPELKDWDRDELVETLLSVDVPCAPVNEPADLLDDPHLDATNLLIECDARTEDGDQRVGTLLTPIRGKRTQTVHRSSAPALGEHSREVLRDFGFETDMIEQLIQEGTVEE